MIDLEVMLAEQPKNVVFCVQHHSFSIDCYGCQLVKLVLLEIHWIMILACVGVLLTSICYAISLDSIGRPVVFFAFCILEKTNLTYESFWILQQWHFLRFWYWQPIFVKCKVNTQFTFSRLVMNFLNYQTAGWVLLLRLCSCHLSACNKCMDSPYCPSGFP